MFKQHKALLKAVEDLRSVAEQDTKELTKALLEVINSNPNNTRRERQVVEFVLEQIREHVQDLEKERGGDLNQSANKTYIDKMGVVGRAVSLATNSKKKIGPEGVAASVFDDVYTYDGGADELVAPVQSSDRVVKLSEAKKFLEANKPKALGKRSRIIISNE